MKISKVSPIFYMVVIIFTTLAVADDGVDTKGGKKYAGYLFAHMTKEDYGKLYYSVSADGMKWRMLNGGKRIFDEYRGHPDITLGHDGRYYLLGNHPQRRDVRIWVSSDLVTWTLLKQFVPEMDKVPEFKQNSDWQGAPKMFYDEAAKQYVITWHSSMSEKLRDDSEAYWRNMRTLYTTTKDFGQFSVPKRLFSHDMATIDVIIRKDNGKYHAIIKDERMPTWDWPTGKSIRICTAQSATGPYSKPGPGITTNFREAPTVIPRLDGTGWLMYYEQYPGVSYGLSTARMLAGPWYEEYWDNFSVPGIARHGCMIPLSKAAYEGVVKAFGADE